MAEAEEAEAERINESVEETGAANNISDINNEVKAANDENNREVLQQLIEEKITVSKNVVYKIIEISYKGGDVSKSKEAKQILSDAIEKLTGSVDTDIKTMSDAAKQISDLDKSSGTSLWKTLCSPFKTLREAYRELVDSPKERTERLVLDKYININEDPESTVDQKIEAGIEYQKIMDEIKPELDKSDEAVKSKYGEALSTFMKLLFLAGGVIGVLAIVARSLNGCYQYKIGKDRLKLLTCDDFYHKDENHSYCSCGSPSTPLVCDNNTNNYPYCKCAEPGVNGQVCNMETGSTSQLYYSYDDSHSAWSVFGDVIVGAYGLLKDVPKDVSDVWAWFKKYGWIILLVLGIVIGLPFIIGAINTTKEIYHFVHPEGTGTTETTTKNRGESHFKAKKH